MTQALIAHALGLHMHQPPGNLKLLIESNEWEAEQIIRCYERPARYAHQCQDIAHLHVGFSGILLEQFLNPEIVDGYRKFIDIPAVLDSYRTASNIELIGMGYYHPVFPLIPMEDWEEHLIRGCQIIEQVFGRSPKGFWPPEMAFCMEMIPALVKAGYEYVVVDGVHVQPENGKQDIYQPYRATYDGATITIIPRERDLSNAQESGMDATWFAQEIQYKVKNSPHGNRPSLVTTWSDGENGGWFRQMSEESGFFGHFLRPFVEKIRSSSIPVCSVSLSEYIKEHPPTDSAFVRTGAWNVGTTSGFDFSQWAGSDTQKQGVEAIRQVSARYWNLLKSQKQLSEGALQTLKQARELILEGETSCFLFWGDDWVPKLYERTEPANNLLKELI